MPETVLKITTTTTTQFYTQNPNFDVLNFNFHNPEELNKLKWDGLDKENIIKELKAHQRVLRIHPDVEVAKSLLDNGLDSACKVAAMPRKQFAQKLAACVVTTNNTEDNGQQAVEIHKKAVQIKNKVNHLAVMCRDLGPSHFKATAFYNIPLQLTQDLESLPDYEDLFGSLDYFRCNPSYTIFSPAAYFLDLMRITDQYITTPNTGTIPDGYKLRERRPDLFEMKLDGDNTNRIISYLQLINEILQRRIEIVNTGTAQSGAASSITLSTGASSDDNAYNGLNIEITGGTGKDQIRTITSYNGTSKLATVDKPWDVLPDQTSEYRILDDVYKILSTAGYPFILPFNLPLQQIRLCLETLNTSLAEIYLNFLKPQNTGKVQSGETSSITLASDASIFVDAYKDMQVEITGGKGKGQKRAITSYAGATKRAVVSENWDPMPDTTSSYRITDPGDYAREYLKLSIEESRIITTPDASLASLNKYYGYNDINNVIPYQGTGKITFTIGTKNVHGTGVDFKAVLNVGDQIQCGNNIRTVAEIKSAQELLVESEWESAATDQQYTVWPQDGLDRVGSFLYRTGLTREEMNDLFIQGLSQDELSNRAADKFFINNTAEPDKPVYLHSEFDKKDPGNPCEKILGLTLKRLDRLHRFIRLKKALGWTGAELDWALVSIDAGELDATALFNLARIKRLQDWLKLPVDVLCSFWHDLKIRGKGNGPGYQDLFDVIFNNPALLDGKDPYDPNTTIPFDWDRPLKWDVTDEAGQNAAFRSRLTGALCVGDNDLTLVAEYLLALDNQKGQPLELNLSNLTMLYRLTKLPKVFGLTPDEFLTILCLLYYPDKSYLDPPANGVNFNLDHIMSLQDWLQWLAKSPFNGYELQYIITGRESDHLTLTTKPSDVRLFIQNLAVMSQNSLLAPEQFVFEDIDGMESSTIYNQLIAHEFVTNLGVFQQKVDYDSLFSIRSVTELSLITSDVNADDAKTAYNLLKTKNIIDVNGNIVENFSTTTDLSFLFPDDNQAGQKQEEVRSILFQIQNFVLTIKNTSFQTNDISLDESNQVFNQLVQYKICDVSGKLQSGFTGDTSLDFLFCNDVKAVYKTSEVRAILLQFKRDIDHTLDILTTAEKLQETVTTGKLADFLGTTFEMLAIVMPSVTPLKPVDYLIDLLTPLAQDQEVPEKLTTLIGALSRSLMLIGKLNLTVDQAGAVVSNPPYFNIDALTSLTMENICSLADFKALVNKFKDTGGALIQYFEEQKDQTLPGPKIAALAKLTGWDSGQITALIESFWPQDAGDSPEDDYTTVAGIKRLDRCFDICASTGCDAYFLQYLCYLGKDLNVALGKPATQSSTIDGGTPDRAVDGDTDGIYADGSVTQTNNDNQPWWQVDLGGSYQIQNIVLWNRTDACQGRLTNFYVFVSDTPFMAQTCDEIIKEQPNVFSWQYGSDIIPVSVTVPVKRTGRYVRVQLTGMDNLSLAEIQVFGDDNDVAGLAMLGAVSSKYVAGEFSTIIKKITDTLDTMKRDALLGYCIWLLGKNYSIIKKPTDIYQYLLIDPEMSSRATTSRISQGMASVQLYMQRCRMNLEQGISISDIDIPDIWWEWMSSYRIWEANRKIFLYPENYLDPTLRRNVSPQFKELSDELLQTHITDETVGNVFTNYFEKFTALANLVHCGSYNVPETDPDSGNPTSTLYLIGRTNTQPYTYYFRCFDHQTSWSPWEKIDLSIPSPLVAPAYAFKKVFIFWAEISPAKSSNFQNNNLSTQTAYKATIKYSFYDFKKNWVQPQVLFEDLIIGVYPNDDYSPLGDYHIKEVYDTNNFFWNVPHVITVGSESNSEAECSEKLLILYGAALNLDDKFIFPEEAAPKIKNPTHDDFLQYKQQFYSTLFNSQTIQTKLVGQKNTGELALSPAAFLEPDLIRQDVNMVMYDYSDNHQPYKVVPDRTNSILEIFPSQNVFYDNYWSPDIPFSLSQNALPGMFIGKGTISMKDATITGTSTIFTKQVFEGNKIGYYDRGLYRYIQSTVASIESDTSLTWTTPLVGGTFNNASYFIIPSSIDLFYNISDSSSLINVSNQPGWMIFNNGDEAFLVISQEGGLKQISDIISLDSVPISDSLVAETVSCGPNTDKPTPFEDLKFAFTRLTTAVAKPLSQKMFAGGIDALLSVDSQQIKELDFTRFYQSPDNPPPGLDTANLPPDQIDFNGPNGLYFWEIFFHMPFLVADRLNTNQRFEEAKRWYQYIFNPTQKPDDSSTSPNRFWRFLPFQNLNLKMRLSDILEDQAQIAAYNDDPFDPDAIARLRPSAYPKAIAMKYMDNLLNYGDFLFAQDTPESINQAANLYVMVSDLLGKRPEDVGDFPIPKAKSFNEIKQQYQGTTIPQFLIELENSLPAPSDGSGAVMDDVPFNDINAYFGVPENEQFIRYWDRVEDRLYKIRHCLNLQGVERPLALFAPPIDPGQLMRAAVSGQGDLSIAGQLQPPIPYYRFSYLLEKAKGVISNLIQLGSSLLAALEKKDAEQLSLIKNVQEKALLNLNTLIKQRQVDETMSLGVSLEESRNSAKARNDYYTILSQKGLSPGEIANIAASATALYFNIRAGIAKAASSIAYAIPETGSPFAMTYGGREIGAMLEATSGVFEIGSMVSSFVAQTTLTMAGYERRAQEWDFQARLAGFDIKQIEAQISANGIRQQIVKRELEVHELSIRQNAEMEQYLTGKFTNQELYQWMVSRLSALYFQTYSLAYDIAVSAQLAYQYELDSSQTFVNFGYWDNLHKGLTAGEGLMLALNQMEKAYIDNNRRCLEVEKTISLMQLNPKALLDLKNTGECLFEFPEKLFDYDYPGHYRRKIKTISISIPAIVGPYQNIKATLTQLANYTIIKPDAGAVDFLLGGPNATDPGPDVLRSNWWTNQQIVISKGVNDSGMFELSFRDEQYLPFEGTGAVSNWKLCMPLATNLINFNDISDVIINLKYTAVNGGDNFRDQVIRLDALKPFERGRIISLSQEYPREWYAFLQDHSDVDCQKMDFGISGLVPPNINNVVLESLYFKMDTASGVSTQSSSGYINFQVNGGDEFPQETEKPVTADGYTYTFEDGKGPSLNSDNDVKVKFVLSKTPDNLKKDGFLDPDKIKNITIILGYRGEVSWNGKNILHLVPNLELKY